MSKYSYIQGNPYHNGPIIHNCSIPLALLLSQILLLLDPYNCSPPLAEVEVVAAGIVVVDTTIDTGYTRFLIETVVPSKTIAQAETDAQPETTT